MEEEGLIEEIKEICVANRIDRVNGDFVFLMVVINICEGFIDIVFWRRYIFLNIYEVVGSRSIYFFFEERSYYSWFFER